MSKVWIGRQLFRFRGQLAIVWLLLIFLYARPSVNACAAGLLLVLLGELLRLHSVRHIGSGSRRRDDALGELCQQGPYAWVRNPLYLANLILWCGVLVSANRWEFGFVLLIIASQYHCIVAWEEWNWRSSKDHRTYQETVPRWIPDWKRTTVKGAVRVPYAWSVAIRSERSTLLAVLSVYVFLTFRILQLK